MYLFYLFCLLINVIFASPSLNLEFSQSTDGNNWYSVQVNNVEWLQSGQLEGYFDNKWYTANTTKANNDNKYNLMSMTSHSVSNNNSDKFGGSYSEYKFEWKAGNLIFETNFKIYNDQKAISFVQSFPNGVNGTNYTSVDKVLYCYDGPTWYHDPFLTFPSFNTFNKTSLYSKHNLGYLTWNGVFSYPDYGGKTPLNAVSLSGIKGGPVVLFDENKISIMVSTNDHFSTSTQINHGPDTDWKIGIASTVKEIPSSFKHETVIVIGHGINDVILNEWATRLQSKYNTYKIDDIVLNYLGYWTDNGAYFYGDGWNNNGGTNGSNMNLTCCSLEVFKNVKIKLDEQNIPIKYWQMDDWWYSGLYERKYWGGVKAVKHWEPPANYYPGGLAALSDAIKVPLLLYAPYFSPDNDWSSDFSFIPKIARTDYVLPSPEDSYSFYSTLLDFGINASTPNGMAGYEIDFMNCLSGTPEFRTNINAQHEWLAGMNKALLQRNLAMQYCMALPMNLMESLSFPSVTNGRASGDYAIVSNWNIGAGSLLWSALGLRPSKDNFWTMFNEPYPIQYRANGQDHNSTEVHAIVALMSSGPVGISDGFGYSNYTLIMRLCRSDGRLLQPVRPITAIDDEFSLKVFNNININVWSTEFGPYLDDKMQDVQIIGCVVLAINMVNDYEITYNSFTPKLNSDSMYIVRNWHNYTNCKNGTLSIENNCIELVAPNSNNLYVLKQQKLIYPMHESFELLHIIQNVSFSSIILLGELNKYVSVSQHRFSNLNINGLSMSVTITGKAKETVSISILKPTSNQNDNDWNIYTYDVDIGSNGKTQFNM
eukprot:237575_1